MFFAWNPWLYRGKTRVPKRSLGLLIIATALSLVWFVESWKYGLEYQGRQYTQAICVVNGVWLAALWILLASRWDRDSVTGNLLLHWLLFAWLGWYAFPYLGEVAGSDRQIMKDKKHIHLIGVCCNAMCSLSGM